MSTTTPMTTAQTGKVELVNNAAAGSCFAALSASYRHASYGYGWLVAANQAQRSGLAPLPLLAHAGMCRDQFQLLSQPSRVDLGQMGNGNTGRLSLLDQSAQDYHP
jgi:hypothetical protein